jgi:hypothetical protein
MSSNQSAKPLAKPLKGQSSGYGVGNFSSLNVASLNVPGLLQNGQITNIDIADSVINNTVIGQYGPNPGYFSQITSYGDVTFINSSSTNSVIFDAPNGILTVDAELRVNECSFLGNIEICQNTIRSINTNGDINISPNGFGNVKVNGSTSVTATTGNIDATAITGNVNIKSGDQINTTSDRTQRFITNNGSIVLQTDTIANIPILISSIVRTQGSIIVTTPLPSTCTTGNVITFSSTGTVDSVFTVGNIISPNTFLVPVPNQVSFVNAITSGSFVIAPGNSIFLNSRYNIIVPDNIPLVFGNTANNLYSSSTNGLYLTSRVLNVPDNFVLSNTSSNLTFSGGNLFTNNTNTYLNGNNTLITDPIPVIGNYESTVTDPSDRGQQFPYIDSNGIQKIGWYGYKKSFNAFTFIPDAIIIDKVVNGSQGNIAYNGLAVNTVTLFSSGSGAGSVDANCGSFLNVAKITACRETNLVISSTSGSITFDTPNVLANSVISLTGTSGSSTSANSIYANSSGTLVLHSNTSTNVDNLFIASNGFVSVTSTLGNAIASIFSTGNLGAGYATISNLQTSNLVSGTVSFTVLNANTIYGNSATIPNLVTNNTSTANSVLQNITSANIISTNVLSNSISSANTIFGNTSVSNLNSVNQTNSNSYLVNVTSTNLISTNAITSVFSSANSFLTNINSVNAVITNETVSNLNTTFASIGNMSTGTIYASSTLFQTQSVSNLYYNNATGGNLNLNRLAVSNSFITNSTITNLNVSSGVITSLQTEIVSTGNLSSVNVNFVNTSIATLNVTGTSNLSNIIGSTGTFNVINANAIASNSLVSSSISSTVISSQLGSFGNITVVNTSTNSLVTNSVTANNLVSNSITASSLEIMNKLNASSGFIAVLSSGNVQSINGTFSNLLSTISSSGSIFASTGLLGLVSSTNIIGTNSTFTNLLFVNGSGSNLVSTFGVFTGLTANNIRSTGLTTTSLIASNSTISNGLVLNLTAGTATFVSGISTGYVSFGTSGSISTNTIGGLIINSRTVASFNSSIVLPTNTYLQFVNTTNSVYSDSNALYLYGAGISMVSSTVNISGNVNILGNITANNFYGTGGNVTGGSSITGNEYIITLGGNTQYSISSIDNYSPGYLLVTTNTVNYFTPGDHVTLTGTGSVNGGYTVQNIVDETSFTISFPITIPFTINTGTATSVLMTSPEKDIGLGISFWSTENGINPSATAGSVNYQTGFLGYKNSLDALVYYSQAEISSDIVNTGTLGTMMLGKLETNKISGYTLEGPVLGNETNGSIDNIAIGKTVPSTGVFTSVSSNISVLGTERFTLSSSFPTFNPSNSVAITYVSVNGVSFTCSGTMGSTLGLQDGQTKIIACSYMGPGCVYNLCLPIGTVTFPSPVPNTQASKLTFKHAGQSVELIWDSDIASWLPRSSGVYVS